MKVFTDFTPGKIVVIYQRPSNQTLTFVSRGFLQTAVAATGYTMSIMAISGLMLLTWPVVSAELSYRINRATQKTKTIATETKDISFGQLMNTSGEGGSAQENPVVSNSAEFSLIIPKIGVNSVVTADVDPSEKDEYLPVLQKSLAHAKGTSKPGDGGMIYIFGHSTDSFWNVPRYNAQFYLLTKLDTGDEIIVIYNGKKYRYEVIKKDTTSPSNVSYLTPDSDGERLILQTCWPGGTAWFRYIVEAVPASL